MDDLKRIVADIESVFVESSYPQAFLDAYDQMECLASRAGRETFLVQKKDTGELAVAKCYDRGMFPMQPDMALLRSFSDAGLPRFYEQYQNDKMLCLVREYIEGDPLSQYARDKQLTLDEIRSLCAQLCDILSLLHTRRPPVVHRDIKPENIIVRPDGRIALIDFDISRTMKQEAETDTVCFGTRGYAPPEQYGFAQTDVRADIYAVGMLLRYLVTGSVRPNRNITMDAGLQQVIDRCTAFSPDDRYQSVQEVKRALLSRKKEKRLSARKLLCATLAGLLCLMAGFCLGRYTDLFPVQPGRIAFSEPLMEAAVRAQLDVADDVPLTREDLWKIKRIYIYGIQTFQTEEDFQRCTVDESVRGQLHSLRDVALLPNLEAIHIVHQGQMDISALANAQNLRTIELKHLHLSDISALGTLPGLVDTVLFDVGISDVTALSACARLETLDIGLNPITAMAQIGVHPNLRYLSLKWLRLDTLEGIEQMRHIRGLFIQDAEIRDLSALKSLPELETVYLDESQAEAVAAQLSGSKAQGIITEP